MPINTVDTCKIYQQNQSNKDNKIQLN
jgi:hypothetical protein